MNIIIKAKKVNNAKNLNKNTKYTIQYKFYCQLPMGAFQRQVLIVQVIKKRKKKYHKLIFNKLLRNYLHVNL